MVEGKRNAEIARILHLSPRTVEKHVAEILESFHAENRATVIIRAMELCAAANMQKTTACPPPETGIRVPTLHRLPSGNFLPATGKFSFDHQPSNTNLPA